MKHLLLTLLSIIIVACGGQRKKTQTAASRADSVEIYDPRIPVMITDAEQRGTWAVDHWWDAFDFADTLKTPHWGAYAEQAFVNFDAQLLTQAPADLSDRAIAGLFQLASANKPVFDRFAAIAEKYLAEPNSPFRNEDLYISVLRTLLASPVLDEWERIRPAEQLRQAMKNRPGDRAADFQYTLANGATGTLHSLRARYKLLFFNNPGCPACRVMMDDIGASPYLSSLIENGTIAVLAVYPDEDLDAWREYLPSMPDGWIVSYDDGGRIKGEELYDLKAIPTIYLLDAAGRVVLKDETSIKKIEQTVYNNENN